MADGFGCRELHKKQPGRHIRGIVARSCRGLRCGSLDVMGDVSDNCQGAALIAAASGNLAGLHGDGRHRYALGGVVPFAGDCLVSQSCRFASDVGDSRGSEAVPS